MPIFSSRATTAQDCTDRMRREVCLDLAEFDAVAVDLDLVVDATQVFQRPICRDSGPGLRSCKGASPGTPLNGSGRKRSAVSSGLFR